MRKQTLSVIVLTKNYEALLENCLRSVAGWADEIIIVDGLSTDATIPIAKKYTDKIFQHPWLGSFSEERNFGIERASMDWCLQIDPDERVTSEFRQSVDELLSKNNLCDAYEFRKKNYFFGHFMGHGGWHHYSLHFFKRTKARYEGIVHETLKVSGSVGKIEAAVEHFPFTSITQFLQRHNRYSTLEAEDEKRVHGFLPDEVILYNLQKKSLKRFFKFFVKKKGFLDGIHGFLFSVLFAWVHFINWAKYWELTREGNLKLEKVS